MILIVFFWWHTGPFATLAHNNKKMIRAEGQGSRRLFSLSSVSYVCIPKFSHPTVFWTFLKQFSTQNNLPQLLMGNLTNFNYYRVISHKPTLLMSNLTNFNYYRIITSRKPMLCVLKIVRYFVNNVMYS